MQSQPQFTYEIVMWALGISSGDVFRFLAHRESLGKIKPHVEAFIYMALHQFAVFIFNENDNSNFDQILQLTKDKDIVGKKRKKKGKKEESKDSLKNSSESQELTDGGSSSSPNGNGKVMNVMNLDIDSMKDDQCGTSSLNALANANLQREFHNHASKVSLMNQISLKKNDNKIKNIMNEFELDQF